MNQYYLPVLTSFYAFAWWMGSASPAYAYLDPGTGSLLLQAVIGLLTGVAVGFGFYWKKTKGFLYGLFGRQKDSVEDNKGDS